MAFGPAAGQALPAGPEDELLGLVGGVAVVLGRTEQALCKVWRPGPWAPSRHLGAQPSWH